jgi:hypothetical protein
LTGARALPYRRGVRFVASVALVAGLVSAAASLAAQAPARAPSKLDNATAQAFGGTYALDCRKAAGVRLVVAADTLAVEAGKRRVESHDVQKALTFGGGAPPADYRGTLLGDVPGGEPLVFQTYRDARGVYLVVDGDAGLQAEFGKAAFTGKFRACEGPAKSAPPPAGPPPKPKSPGPAR